MFGQTPRSMNAADAALLAAAGVTTGAINAVAGGGSLVSFPAMLATGLSPLSANVSNLIATLPGYVSAAATSRAELEGQHARIRALAAAGAIGAAVGTTLLLVGPADTFAALAPWLVLLACALLAVQPFVSKWVARVEHHTAPTRLVVSVGIASIYGGYFGAGLGIILLAALGLTLEQPLQKLNAIKQVLSLTVAIVSAIAVALFGPVDWLSALVVGLGTLVGGRLGVGVARRLPDPVLRGAVIALGVTVAVVLLVRGT
jgi:uncharacterized membrane protein YfcA